MTQLIIWAQSDCRSTMGLYDALARMVGCPVTIALWFFRDSDGALDNRGRIGFSPSEFGDRKTVPVGEDYERGIRLMDEHPGAVHVFTVFQNSPAWRALIAEARRRGEHVVIACESPCNMEKGFRKILKEIYLNLILRRKARHVIDAADCFINYSGNDDKYALRIGWPKKKIIPFGYYPPPIPASHCVMRENGRPFHILATGVLSKYRGADLLVEALRILQGRGVKYRATITQEGELLPMLKSVASKNKLPIDFCGFVKMPDLIRLYETCSVYVGAGRHEPWGMRLNDALQCGAPLVVSRGMGGVKLIDDYECGLAFKCGDALDLADKLQDLATNQTLYRRCARNAVHAAGKIAPGVMAAEFLRIITSATEDWR